MPKNEAWDRQINECFALRFSGSPHALESHVKLWDEHHAAGLAGSHFVSELTSSSDEKFRQRVWEMSLGRHLRACGHQITTRPEGEPDYRFEIGDQTVWVEAICPTAGPDLPRNWTTFNPANPSVGPVPNREMLLRWTSAFKEKSEKCWKYREKGIVQSSDSFVVAIDGCQLSRFPDTHGISRLPFIVEVVFAIGPLAIEVDQATRRLGRAFQTVEAAVENRNKALVSKELFFRDEFSGISAILGSYVDAFSTNALSVQVAYNPLAQSPITPGFLGAGAEEWTATLLSEDADGADWSVHRVQD